MNIVRYLLINFTCLLLATAGHAAEETYNPLAKGLRWVADVVMTTADGKTTKGTATREIPGTEVINEKTYFICNTTVEGIPGFKPFTTYRRKGPEGEFAINAADPKKQENLEFPLPLAVGKTWEVPGEKGKVLFKVEGSESVKVGAKQYEKCFKISYASESGDFKSTLYLAPNIGNVTETMKIGGTTLVFSHRTLTKPK
ncbi:MAG: hypothetical protein K8R23_01130 [Chthoniobacter sp.]|nr:hypothetical protein [Chthoniobacter sp.]